MKQEPSENLEKYLKCLRKFGRVSNVLDSAVRDSFLNGITSYNLKYIVDFIKYDIKRRIGKPMSSFKALETIQEYIRENSIKVTATL